jgi:hypothetical protein
MQLNHREVQILIHEGSKHKSTHKAQIMKGFTHPFSAAASSVKKQKALEAAVPLLTR